MLIKKADKAYYSVDLNTSHAGKLPPEGLDAVIPQPEIENLFNSQQGFK